MSVYILSTSALVVLLGLSGCQPQAEDTWPVPRTDQITSKAQRNPQETLLVALTSSGGGAGDLTYRILMCKSGSKICELLGSIDTNDAASPVLSKTKDGVELIVNEKDYLADFRNFSRELGTLQPGELRLRYRVDISKPLQEEAAIPTP
jgi:hypothetical protein